MDSLSSSANTMSDVTLTDPVGFIGDYRIKTLQGSHIQDEKPHQTVVELQTKLKKNKCFPVCFRLKSWSNQIT